MKRFMSVFLILSLAAALCACGGAAKPAATEATAAVQPTAAATEPAPKETESVHLLTVAYVPCGMTSDWDKANISGYEKAFSGENGFELLLADPGTDGISQVEAVRECIRQGADYLVIAPLQKDGWKDVLQETKDAGIPVIIAGRDIDVKASMYDAYIGSDPEAEGKLAANWLAEYLRGKKAQIVMIEGTEGDYVTRWRNRGFEAVAAENTQWKILDRKFGDFTREGGKAAMESMIVKNRKFDVVVCHNEAEVFGAMEALDAAGITYGTEGDVILICFDASREGLTLTMEGKIHCNVEYSPMQAEKIRELIDMMEEGKEFPSFTLVQSPAFQTPGIESDYAWTVTQEILDSREY